MIRYARMEDKEFWYSLDGHLPEGEFPKKVAAGQCYVMTEGEEPVGLLRYHLFWDSIPFCTMLVVRQDRRGKGYGKRLMAHWEADMRAQGWDLLMTSTQADETAQHFYRKLGYQDCGALFLDIPPYAQPAELFLRKPIAPLGTVGGKEGAGE